MEKEKMEILDIIESNLLIINENVSKINDLKIIDTIEKFSKSIGEINIKDFDNKMFKFNNDLKNIKSNYLIDIKSYNIAMMDILSKYLFTITKKFKNQQFILTLNNLNETQRRIIELIYKCDGIDSRTVKKHLNISSQYLYNITHSSDFLKLINIYDDCNKKFKHYSLNLNCRTYLDKLYKKAGIDWYKGQSENKFDNNYFNCITFSVKEKNINIQDFDLFKNKFKIGYKKQIKESKYEIFKTSKKNNIYGKISIE